uniref:DUF4283 domain-containing protein n=2 Tax=Cucumis melo TaxID=3656 RepID=A0A9I9CIT8_CUCME|nr:hypothetical protein [Cucumis melo subsp. melo]
MEDFCDSLEEIYSAQQPYLFQLILPPTKEDLDYLSLLSMSSLRQLPRSCTIEKKDFVLSLDNRSRDLKMLITEVGPYKSFSIAVTLESLEWLKSTFKTLLDTPLTTRFFLKKRFEEYCLWVQKTYNRKGRTVVLTRRYFHDDWEKIVEKLNEQLDTTVSYKPFHANKALICFKDFEQANLICKNKGWTTVGRFYVKFEEWNQKDHASPKFVPSYGGWIKVRAVPLHAWNLESFVQIGDACGGFMEVAKETRELTDLIEASIRVKDNYSGFIPAFIKLIDKEERSYIIQVIVKTEGKWHLGRNPSIHGTFTREAARRFDEFNLNSEQYFFEGNLAISPEKAVSMVIGKEDWKKKGNGPLLENNKKLGAMMDFLNYDGDSDSSEKRKMEIVDEELSVISQKGGKLFYKGENSKSAGQKRGKRKVSFDTPKSKTFLYDRKSAPQTHYKINSPLESPKKKLLKKFEKESKGKGKKIYKIKSPNSKPVTQKEKRQKEVG